MYLLYYILEVGRFNDRMTVSFSIVVDVISRVPFDIRMKAFKLPLVET